uniref:SWIM-type domain-containing protein n=1 Tax=Anguilla anguilla TaxID=7936 RepID=A0A0E9X6I0_ANGAN
MSLELLLLRCVLCKCTCTFTHTVRKNTFPVCHHSVIIHKSVLFYTVGVGIFNMYILKAMSMMLCLFIVYCKMNKVVCMKRWLIWC